MQRYIHIAVHYVANGCRILQRGEFPVMPSNYIKDEKREAARIAYDFIEQIRRKNSYRITLEKVLYNGNDITDMFKDLF